MTLDSAAPPAPPALQMAPLVPVMAAEEVALLSGILLRTRRYLEFGCGGSTYLAAGLVRDRVVSIDSSAVWIAQVQRACAADPARLVPDLRCVDIGALGKWGMPIDAASKPRWSQYHAAIWRDPAMARADFCLVDGRFRVASAMQVLLNIDGDCLFGVHDYDLRPGYAPIARVAQEVARVKSLVIFKRPKTFNRAKAEAILARHAFLPA